MSTEIKTGQVWAWQDTDDARGPHGSTFEIVEASPHAPDVTYQYRDSAGMDAEVMRAAPAEVIRANANLVQGGDEATPAPLDPSKVKAGDMVRVLVVTIDSPIYEVSGEAYMLGHAIAVGGHVLTGPGVTLTDHQPAPEPEPEWEPGTVGTAGTVRGLTYTGPVVRADNPVMPWWTPAYIGGAHWHREADVTDFVPDEPRAVWSRQGLRAALVHSDSLKTDPGTGMTYIDPDLATERLAAYMRGESR